MGSGWSNITTSTNRGRTNERVPPSRRNRTDPPYLYPYSWNFNTYENTDHPQPSDPPKPDPEPERENQPGDNPNVTVDIKVPLKVKAVDLNVKANGDIHNTSSYDIVEAGSIDADGKSRPPQLVVRRGDAFDITVTFDRDHNKQYDQVTVVLEIGPRPKESKGTLIYLELDGMKKQDDWGSEMKEVNGNVATLSLKAAPDSIIGIWDLEIQTSLRQTASATGNDRKEINRYLHNQPIYILFNAWCKDDKVFLDDEVLRDEYVLNDTGKIFTGSSYQMYARPWDFGQFDGSVLDCSMLLLDRSRLNYQSRGNPVSVSRAISAVVNNADESGVLVGNWSGNYGDGKKPTSWIGSVKILDQYYKTKEPVKYGQCWVFSGVVTSVSRAIGLPCRSVTNFSSAHDTDGTITIDKHFDIDGKAVKRLDDDSIWNFHVWNEGWMARRDLPSGFGGWQAFDATPQETSDGIYRAGPASVAAIKEGKVNNLYDAPFIFAEVNADVIHWKVQEDRKLKKFQTDKNRVGKKISTHRPRKNPRPESWFANMYRMSVDDFRDDITNDYKYKEGTEEERAAVYRANLNSTVAGEVYGEESGAQDVKFQLKQKDGVVVGSVFNVVLEMQNTSREERTVHAQLEISPVFYTGAVTDADKPIKSQSFDVTLPPVKTKEAVMRVTVDEYIHKIVEQVTFEISVYTRVEETEQEYATRELYRLRRPDLIITAPNMAKVAERVTVKIKLESPMPIPLTECEWNVEGAHLMKPMEIKQNDLEPFEHVEISVDITPMKAGQRELIASFSSKELQDVTSSHHIMIFN